MAALATMPRPILSRPRTRIYDSNYNAGESYYRPALDRLDRKYSGRPLSPLRKPQSTLDEIAERHGRVFSEAPDEDLIESRKRAERAISESNAFDQIRQGSIRSRTLELLGESENGLNNEFASSTVRSLRASKKVARVDDVDLESTSNALKTHRLLNRSERILDSVGIGEERRVRALEEEVAPKRRSWRRDEDELTRWTALEDGPPAGAAALRAKASKARLEDIEDEMAEMQEKQAARERRVARLKALVAECESETVDDVVERSVSVSARKEKKTVHF